MAYPQYIPVSGASQDRTTVDATPDGSQQIGIGGMWVPTNQAPPPIPMFVNNPTSTVYHPPASSFMQHRSSMVTGQQRAQQHAQPQHPPAAQAYNTPLGPNTTPASMTSPSHTPTTAPSHLIATGSLGYQLQSFLNVPSGIAVHTSPIHHSPYDMALYPSPDSGPPSATLSEPTGYGMKPPQATPLGDRLAGQQSTSHIYSHSDTSETPLSAAFPQNMQRSYTPSGQQYRSNVPFFAQWAPVQQQGLLPVHGTLQGQQFVPVQQGNSIQNHYQSGQPQSNLTSYTFTAPQSTPVICQYPPSQLHASGLRPPCGPGATSSSQRAAQQAEPVHNPRPFVVTPSAPPLSQPHLSANQHVQMEQQKGEASRERIHHGHRGMPAQHGGIPAGFTASHSQIPSTGSAGYMVSDEGEEEEYGGTFGFDPYLVRHRKRTTPQQLLILENAFDEGAKPTAAMRKSIGERIGMTPRSVQVWFQNRRQKKKLLANKKLEEGSSEAPDSPARPSSSAPKPYIMGPPTTQFIVNDGSTIRYAVPGSSQTPVDRSSVRRGSIAQQSAYNGVPGVMKVTPLIQQARRGSLPYPPPQAPGPHLPKQHPTLARTVSSAGLARAQIPAHLVVSSTERRASLPLNSQSVSLGFFTPPRIGPKALHPMGALASITDEEQVPNRLTSGASYGQQRPSTISSSSGVGELNHPLREDTNQPAQNGPLPNPEFSFGNNGTTLRKASFASSVSVSPNVASPTFPQAFLYRNRMGSMASILSQATTTDGTSDSDWERTQQLVTPFLIDNGDSMNMFVGMPPDIGTAPNIGQGYHSHCRQDGMDVPKQQLLLPPSNDTRRASAPAELLQQFAILDVEQHKQQIPTGHKRNSPLNISFTEGNQEGDSRSDATATASPPEVAVKVLSAGSSSEQMRSFSVRR